MAAKIEISLTGGGGGGQIPPPPGAPGAQGGTPRGDRFDAIQDQIVKLYAEMLSGAKTASEAFRELEGITKKNRDFLNDFLRGQGTIGGGDEAANFYARSFAKGFNAATGKNVAAPYTNTAADDAREKAEADAQKAAEEAERSKADAEKARNERFRTISMAANQVAGSQGVGKLTGLAQLGQVAGVGGAAGGAAAMLAGPEFAAAVALKDAAESLIRMPFQSLREGLETAGNLAKSIAGGDAQGAFEGGVEAVAGGLEKAGLGGVLLAEELRTAAKAATVFTETLNAFADRGKELGRYNSSLAGAAAQQEVRRIRSEIDEANRLGPEYQRSINAQTEFQDAGRDVMVFLKGELMGALNEVAEPIADFLRETKEIRKLVFQGASLVNPLKALIATAPPVVLLKIINALLKFLPGGGDDGDPGLLDGLKKAADNIQINGQPPIPPGPANRAGVNPPGR